MPFILILFLIFSIAGTANAGHDIEKIKKVVNDYRETYPQITMEKPSVEELEMLFDIAQLAFPNATNLPSVEDAKKEWIPPKFTKSKNPSVIRALRFKKLPADIQPAILIDESGSVVDAFIIASTNEELNDYALSVVRSWQFKPASIDNTPRKSVIFEPMHFRLMN